ncbi:14356_t:CDS:2 [Funneliformis geosporum]|nr:14356_t:CDS:2 [Funneliformis geosporum]
MNPLSTSSLSLYANVSISRQANQNNGNQDYNNKNVISEKTVIRSHMMSDKKDQLKILEDEEEGGEDNEGSQDSHIIYDKLFNNDQFEVLEEDNDDDNEDSHIIFDEIFNEYQFEVLENDDDDDENNEEINKEEKNHEYNDKISEDLIKGLRLLQIKDRHNVSYASFNKILKVLEYPKSSIHKLRKFLGKIIPLESILIDCCMCSIY